MSNKELYILISLLFFNTIFSPILKRVRYFLFKKRSNPYFKFLYSRVYKFSIPLILLININVLFTLFYRYVLEFETVKYFINIFLISWLSYEVIKYIIYTTINVKLSKNQSVRREIFTLAINLTKILIAIIIIAIILSFIGVNLSAIITSLGIGGVIVGLGAKETLANFFDSIRLISEDAFRVGDWIETKEIEGFVTEVGLISTQIRTFDNALISIPNSQLANSWVKNWSRRIVGRRIKLTLKIKYTSKTQEIEKVLQEIKYTLQTHPKIVTQEKIQGKLRKRMYHNTLFLLEDKYGIRKTLLVYLDNFDDYSMNILIYAFTIPVSWEEWMQVKQDIMFKILKIIDKSELELAYPTSIVYHSPKGESKFI